MITLVTPFIIHDNNYFYVAPEIDTHVASQLISSHLSNITVKGPDPLIYAPMSTDVVNSGTYAIYLGTSHGCIYYYSLGPINSNLTLGTYGKIYNASIGGTTRMLNPVMFPLINCYDVSIGVAPLSLVQRFIALPFSNGLIQVGKIAFIANNLKVPRYLNILNITYNGTLVGNISSNAQPFQGTISTSVPAFNYQGIGLNTPGILYFTVSTNSSNYLEAYEISPYIHLFSTKLNMTNPIGIISYGGSFSPSLYDSQGRVLVYNSSSIIAYNIFGSRVWSLNNYKSISSLSIPSFYQVSFSKNNSLYFIGNNSDVDRLSLSNGSVFTIDNLNTNLYSLTTTPGRVGLPTDVVAMSSTSAFVISYNSTSVLKLESVALPPDSGLYNIQGSYDPISNALIFDSQLGTVISLGVGSSAQEPFTWSAGLSPAPTGVSVPLYFKDAQTGVDAIAITTNMNYIYLFSSTAESVLPIGMTARAPSGASYPLGTTQSGNDVWARFMDSFSYDWFFGITIGLITVMLSLLVALYAGYKTGFLSTTLETFSLALYLVPTLALLIALASIVPPNAGFEYLIVIVSFTGWPFAAFTLIGLVRTISQRSYVEASKIFGSKTLPIMRRHILPNIGPLLMYLLALSISGGIAAVSTLQLLGLVKLGTPTWGGMLSSVYNQYFYLSTAPQLVYPPVIALTLFIVAMILISRGLDEVVNPRLRRR